MNYKDTLGRLRRRLLDERAYSLVELVAVCAILGIVLGALTTLFVSGSKAELELNRRFQAQQNARLALDKIRREAHCASAISLSPSRDLVTLTMPAQCPTGTGSVTWCTSGSGQRFGLYRQLGGTCSAAAPAVRWADYLTRPDVFNYTPQSTTTLAKLNVDFPVDLAPSTPIGKYELIDSIALRNSTRT